MKRRDAVHLVRDAGAKFWADGGPRLGAALAYYTALSLAPLLVVVVAGAGFVFGPEAARGELVGQFRDTIGTEAATVVEHLVRQSASPTHGIVATVLAIGVLLFGATSAFSSLQSALNTIWRVPGPVAESGALTVLKEQLLSFALVCGSAFLLLVSLVVTAVLAGVNSRVAGWVPGMDVLAEVVNFVVNFVLTAALFGMMFKWLPEARLVWRDVGIGAAVTAALFSLGRYLIGLYLGRAAVGSAYGAAGAFVVLLVWIYYSTQILLFGAELTFVHAQRYGSGVRTADGQPVEPRAPGLAVVSAAVPGENPFLQGAFPCRQ
jgi:membrane protein